VVGFICFGEVERHVGGLVPEVVSDLRGGTKAQVAVIGDGKVEVKK
jgi:hypothetical protein